MIAAESTTRWPGVNSPQSTINYPLGTTPNYPILVSIVLANDPQLASLESRLAHKTGGAKLIAASE